MQKTGSDAKLASSSNSGHSSWDQSPAVSPSTSSIQLPHLRPLLMKTDSSDDGASVTGATPTSAGGRSRTVSFTVGGEDEEGYTTEEMMDQKELTKRDIHTLNEQRRRDIIKHGYTTLSELVPTCKQSPNGAKLSRATTLQKTIDYIIFMQKQSVKQEAELERLQREVKALEIMKENYEQIAQAHQHTSVHEAPQVPDHVKFLVFQSMADQLFQSFNSSISLTSFDTLSSCIISWLEEYCKPEALRSLVVGNLQRVNALSASSPVFPSQQQQQQQQQQQSLTPVNSDPAMFVGP